MQKKLYLVVITLLILSFCGCSGTKEYVQQARDTFSKGEYNESAKYYEKAISNWDDKIKYEYSKEEIQNEFIKAKDKADEIVFTRINSELQNENIDVVSEILSKTIFWNPDNKVIKDLHIEVQLIEQLKEVAQLFKDNDIKAAADNLSSVKTQINENGVKDNIVLEKYSSLAKQINEKKQRFDNALKKMRTKFDDMEKITWYYDKSTTPYSNRNSVHLYFGMKADSSPWLRFRIQFEDDDWLFIKSYIFKADDSNYDYTPSSVEQDNNYGRIWEWSDQNVDETIYGIVTAIVYSKICKIRFNGSQYYKDRVITQEEKYAMRNVLDAYEALGGTTTFND